MFPAVITAITAFISTNLDDILILTLLFAQAETGRAAIVAGQFAGIGILTAVSLLGAGLVGGLPRSALALLGLVPIALGIRTWVCARKERGQEPQAHAVGLFQVMLLTLANGGDNLGVYVPLFAGSPLPRAAAAAVVFALMTGLWCLLGMRLAALPGLRAAILRHRHWVVPAVLAALGVFIILEHTLL